MRFRFLQRDEIYTAASLPIMAVDLGFAGKKTRSCGLAWKARGGECQTEVTTFGRCVEHVARFVSENPNSALIVEAPLSGLFDSSGNPKGRLPFEKSCVSGEARTRYWYVQSGAAVGLGAVFLFANLSAMVGPQRNIPTSVVEGFVSFKSRRSDHAADARALLEALNNPDTAKIYDVSASEGERRVNMLSLAGLVSSEEPCPAVVVVTV
jgi:hypothetical protein